MDEKKGKHDANNGMGEIRTGEGAHDEDDDKTCDGQQQTSRLQYVCVMDCPKQQR